MPTKQPVPPPKFNIRDQILYNFIRWKVTNRKYKRSAWFYELESVEQNKQGVYNTEANEKFITLAPPSPHDPMHFSKPAPPPPRFQVGDLVWFKNGGREIRAVMYDDIRLEYMYKISVYPGGSLLYDSLIGEFELEPYNNPPTPQETKTILPVPKFMEGDLVKYLKQAGKILSCSYNAEKNRHEYEVLVAGGGCLRGILEKDLKLEEIEGPFDDMYSIWLEEPSPFKHRKSATVVNEHGGKQSHLDARFDCIPPVVLRLLAQCLGFGARKYGNENWKNIPQQDHLNHAMNHINEWNRFDRSEPHLVNAMARLTFALWQAVDNNTQPDTYIHPEDNK